MRPTKKSNTQDLAQLPPVGSPDWQWKYSTHDGYWCSKLHNFCIYSLDNHVVDSAGNTIARDFVSLDAAKFFVEAMLQHPVQVAPEKPTYLVVLEDGETWAPVSACTFVAATTSQLQQLRFGVSPRHIKDLAIAALTAVVAEAHCGC